MNYQELKSMAYHDEWVRPMLAKADAADAIILAERQRGLDQREGIDVGDFILDGDKVLRVTHNWGDSVQTTCRRYSVSEDASFYLGEDGYVSFSGGLDPAIPKTRFELTDERRDGSCWFFSQNMSMAHNGHHVTAKWKVWRLIPPTP